MEKQSKLRAEMINLVEKMGIKYNFIGKATNISPQLLSRFKKELTNLGSENIESLDNFLQQYRQEE